MLTKIKQATAFSFKVVFNSLQIGFWGAGQLSRVKRYQIFIAGNAVSVINLNNKALVGKNLDKSCQKMVGESTTTSNSTRTTKIIQK